MFGASTSGNPLRVSALTERTKAIRPFLPGNPPIAEPGTAAATTATSPAARSLMTGSYCEPVSAP
jgi:hypothetical protein